MERKLKNIIVFAAHPDDELLGAGGTVKRLSSRGAKVHAVILSEGLTSRKDNREDTSQSQLKELQKDACKAACEAGYESIDFCCFPDNRMDAVDLLEIVKTVSSFIEKYDPDTIFTHHHGDLNIDHNKTCKAVLTACRPGGNHHVERIFAFETPSSTEWNFVQGEPFQPNVFIDVSDTLEAKIRGMACYKTESTAYPHPRSPQALRALAQYRGSNAGVEAAEAFELLREIIF